MQMSLKRTDEAGGKEYEKFEIPFF